MPTARELRKRFSSVSESDFLYLAREACFLGLGREADALLFSEWLNRPLQDARLESWLKSCSEGQAPQHLTGIAYFLGRRFQVDASTLIPRPETEGLALECERALSPPPRLGLEIGVGSGVIAISLALRFPELELFATECVEQALSLAGKNIRTHLGARRERLHLLRAATGREVFEPLEQVAAPPKGRLDFIVSNPPYLASESEMTASVAGTEPKSALIPEGGDADYFYEVIAREGRDWLAPRGKAFLEIPHERALEIKKTFSDLGWEVEIKQDLSGRDRVLIARGSQRR